MLLGVIRMLLDIRIFLKIPEYIYYIITNDNKKVYFGQASASDFTLYKNEAPQHGRRRAINN